MERNKEKEMSLKDNMSFTEQTSDGFGSALTVQAQTNGEGRAGHKLRDEDAKLLAQGER